MAHLRTSCLQRKCNELRNGIWSLPTYVETYTKSTSTLHWRVLYWAESPHAPAHGVASECPNAVAHFVALALERDLENDLTSTLLIGQLMRVKRG